MTLEAPRRIAPSAWRQFAYDGNGTRYAVVEDGTATYFLWDGLRLMETRNADYSLKARFAHGPARIEGIGTCVEVFAPAHPKDSQYYLVTDHRGSVCQVIRFKNNKKETVATRLYNAFGEIISQTGTWPAEVPFGYQTNWLAVPGMTLPDGTQLYLSARVYDPGAGRFLQRDFRRTPGENAYVYASNNPVNRVDPTGLQDDPCVPDLKDKTDEELAEYLLDNLRELAETDAWTPEHNQSLVNTLAAYEEFGRRGKDVAIVPGADRKLKKGLGKLSRATETLAKWRMFEAEAEMITKGKEATQKSLETARTIAEGFEAVVGALSALLGVKRGAAAASAKTGLAEEAAGIISGGIDVAIGVVDESKKQQLLDLASKYKREIDVVEVWKWKGEAWSSAPSGELEVTYGHWVREVTAIPIWEHETRVSAREKMLPHYEAKYESLKGEPYRWWRPGMKDVTAEMVLALKVQIARLKQGKPVGWAPKIIRVPIW